MAIASPETKAWLEQVLANLPPTDSPYPSLRQLLDQLPVLANKDVANDQLAAFYRE